jgi:acetyl/propionyl-CoA carboxylase alpha subunit
VGIGDVIGTRYDPLLAKLIAVAEDRKRALDTLDEMLDTTSVVGVTTNRGFLRWLIADRDVRRGALWTTLIDERWAPEGGLPDAAWPAAASALAQLLAGRGSALVGFRLNAAARVRVAIEDEIRSVEVPHGPTAAPWAPTADDALTLDLGGRAVRAALAPPPTVEAAVRGASHDAGAAENVTAPMPGTVIAVRVAAGDEVEPGQVLVVLEAMKMENTVPAPAAGRVERVLVGLGQQVQRGETLVELA